MNEAFARARFLLRRWARRSRVLRSRELMVWPAMCLFALSACISYGIVKSLTETSQSDSIVGPVMASIAPISVVSRPEVKAPVYPRAYGPYTPVNFEPATPPSADAPTGPLSEDSSVVRVTTGQVASGGTVASALAKEGVSSQTIDRISRTMRPVFDFRNAQPGDYFALVQAGDGRVLSFEYQRGRRDVYRIENSDMGVLRASHVEVPLERRVVHLGGVIDRSLFTTVLDSGEKPELVQLFAEIFIWDIDFSSQTRPGDEFRLVFEKFYDREGFSRYGNILAAQYRSDRGLFTALYFEDDKGLGAYYTPEGNSIQRSFLRAPLQFTRISSRYTKSRLHPILKVRRPHEGIDYAAPMGTQIYAVADGQVVFKGWSGGFGRLIKIRHNNGYISYYGHLSAYADGISVGTRVRQKQFIARVGKTGLATGPHLDYRLKKEGHFVDPLKVRFPTGRPVAQDDRGKFEQIREVLLAELRDASPPLVLEAGM